MKKIILVAICAIMSLGASAQIIKSETSERTIVKVETPKKVESWNHSGFFFNTGIGVITGDCDTDFGWEFGMGYRWHIASGISWEILRLGFNTGVSNFEELINIRLTTGIRYDSPRLDFMKGKSLYATFVCGGGVNPEYESTGFVYEVGAGVKLTRNCSVGLFWHGNPTLEEWEYDDYGYDYGDANYGMFGAKIEWLF